MIGSSSCPDLDLYSVPSRSRCAHKVLRGAATGAFLVPNLRQRYPKFFSTPSLTSALPLGFESFLSSQIPSSLAVAVQEESLAACLATPSEGLPDSPQRSPVHVRPVSNFQRAHTECEEEACEEESYWGLAGTSEHLSAAEMRWRDWMQRIRRKKLSEKIQELLLKVSSAPAALFSREP
ncbi:hypothetical protein CEUSTIGMA_g5034.t1 [Chlamydomonas eustigma]|uniref:Uncharacterized protein n=1 Tax=Chlamydomonas eustigma TaxID=1157962 RepID=A0A250X4A9_9CHLO|nr:hypothetical protein CEUSTIGMA_g5034.t1 [Chlamydomonas eustigma]|eukprot:GAX77590.1 hypothetical protein CEUSTIGMA_g5034.t1 [Chlamydomonas eustigma]